MQATSSSGDWTKFEFTRSLVNDEAYYMTIPNASSTYNRCQVLTPGEVRMRPDTFGGNLVSFTFTEVNDINNSTSINGGNDTVEITAIEDVIPELVVFPNPASNFIEIRNAEGIYPIKIYNASGQLIIETTTRRIDISLLSSGLYFLKTDKEKVKFIKN